jgi:hypothetical protein
MGTRSIPRRPKVRTERGVAVGADEGVDRRGRSGGVVRRHGTVQWPVGAPHGRRHGREESASCPERRRAPERVLAGPGPSGALVEVHGELVAHFQVPVVARLNARDLEIEGPQAAESGCQAAVGLSCTAGSALARNVAVCRIPVARYLSLAPTDRAERVACTPLWELFGYAKHLFVALVLDFETRVTTACAD